MKTTLTLLIFFSGLNFLHGSNWRPHDRLLDAVCEIESNGGTMMSGDRGHSLGRFQLTRSAWADVVEWRKKRNLPVHDYEKNVWHRQVSRMYAADFLTILHDCLQQQYKREPTPEEIYAAYNMGLRNFRKCNFSLAQVNPATEARCKQVAALLE